MLKLSTGLSVRFGRCDVLPDTEPPLCAHCKQYNYDCTFFLPIQETRFKKKRAEEDHSLQMQQSRPYSLNGSPDRHDAGTVRTYGKGVPTPSAEASIAYSHVCRADIHSFYD